MSDYMTRRGDIFSDAYNELIELVVKHGNRRLKDLMWELTERTSKAQQAAHDETKAHRAA